MATQIPSSLEIAQSAILRPVGEIAEEAGLLPDEVELYGRYKAKIDLAVLDRLADRPDGKLIEPFVLERFYTDTLVSELAAAAVSH